jgi:hypothetical protein
MGFSVKLGLYDREELLHKSSLHKMKPRLEALILQDTNNKLALDFLAFLKSEQRGIDILWDNILAGPIIWRILVLPLIAFSRFRSLVSYELLLSKKHVKASAMRGYYDTFYNRYKTTTSLIEDEKLEGISLDYLNYFVKYRKSDQFLVFYQNQQNLCESAANNLMDANFYSYKFFTEYIEQLSSFEDMTGDEFSYDGYYLLYTYLVDHEMGDLPITQLFNYLGDAIEDENNPYHMQAHGLFVGDAETNHDVLIVSSAQAKELLDTKIAITAGFVKELAEEDEMLESQYQSLIAALEQSVKTGKELALSIG